MESRVAAWMHTAMLLESNWWRSISLRKNASKGMQQMYKFLLLSEPLMLKIGALLFICGKQQHQETHPMSVSNPQKTSNHRPLRLQHLYGYITKARLNIKLACGKTEIWDFAKNLRQTQREWTVESKGDLHWLRPSWIRHGHYPQSPLWFIYTAHLHETMKMWKVSNVLSHRDP